MKEKKTTDIKISTFILLSITILLIMILACFGIENILLTNKQTQRENTTQDSLNIAQESQIINEAEKTEEERKEIEKIEEEKPNETTIDTDKIIMEELESRRFLAKNNIDIDSEVKYTPINNGIYIIHVEYELDEYNNRSIYFFCKYKNNNVFFSKGLENKDAYDLYFEENSMTIKAEVEKKGYKSTIYASIKDGEFEQLDEFVEPVQDYAENYLVNEKEVTKTEFENEKAKYDKGEYVDFSSVAKELK